MRATSSDDFVRDPIGSYPSATVACFDATRGDLPRRALDADRMVDFLERLARLGAPAVLIAASTGHGHLRTVEELQQWFGVAARAQLGRTVRIALLRPEDGVDANRRLLDVLRDGNYPIVFVRPGRDLPAHASDEQISANVAGVVSAAAERGFAVGVYSIPDVSGVRLTAAATAMLLDAPGGDRIVAAKITESNYEQSTLQFLTHPRLRRLKIVQGWDPFLARALRDGPRHDDQGRQRCGITSGPMSFAVYQYLHLLEQAERGDWDELQQAQAAVTTLFQSMQDDPARFADLQRAKQIMGLGEPLLGTVSPDSVERVLQALAELGREPDRRRLAMSLDLMQDGPYHDRLRRWTDVDSTTTVAELRSLVRDFVADRNWEQFHAPKNLAMALMVEVAELMEHFQWLSIDDSRSIANDPRRRAAIREELADVFGYTLALANELDLDIASAVFDKMLKNAAKYPVSEYHGRYSKDDQRPTVIADKDNRSSEV
jgi:NTP pyrophosphatase (non-canonical NTP hydrolase)/dihydrodipicolinate synthase/N-acetylneuraminate lyase